MGTPGQERFPPSPVAVGREWVHRVLRAGDTAVDATAGNGCDTEWLARAVGPGGRVFAFDVQPAALQTAAERLKGEGLDGRVEFLLESHGKIGAFVRPGTLAAAVFNLGYLPGGRRDVITRPQSTRTALDAALAALRPGGALSVVCYPGHPGGDEETAAVEEWFTALGTSGARVVRYGAVGTRKPAPLLLFAVKP